MPSHAVDTVRILRDPPLMEVYIDAPERRNAVDGPTAAALAEAFRAFEADEALSVAILSGECGHFCAGADLKAVAGDDPSRNYPAARRRRYAVCQHVCFIRGIEC